MNELMHQALFGPLELLGRQLLTILPNMLAMGAILLGGFFTAWLLSMFVERLSRVVGLTTSVTASASRPCSCAGVSRRTPPILWDARSIGPSRFSPRSPHWAR